MYVCMYVSSMYLSAAPLNCNTAGLTSSSVNDDNNNTHAHTHYIYIYICVCVYGVCILGVCMYVFMYVC